MHELGSANLVWLIPGLPLLGFLFHAFLGKRFPKKVIDPLSMLMCLIVTGIGGLIHLYATGYMADDRDYPRFFTYLNLFIFFMLMLVLGENTLLMFVGGEG